MYLSQGEALNDALMTHIDGAFTALTPKVRVIPEALSGSDSVKPLCGVIFKVELSLADITFQFIPFGDALAGEGKRFWFEA